MKTVKEFLDAHWDKNSPILLGYSGGPDSKALLYSLLEAGCKTVHIAHVDHGWRAESSQEEMLIRQEVEGLKLPYFSTRLSKVAKEVVARDARLSFFRSLFEKTPFQALVLGHQADDLAETILKRIFEGAHLPFLGGMKPVSHFEGMPIWRPLLRISKKELLSYLAALQLTPFVDPTNHDPSYLRSRMRMETIPFLDQSFGKSVGKNLCILADRASELKDYLDRKVAQARIERDATRCTIYCMGLERIELRHLLQKEKGCLTRGVLEKILDWADARTVRKVFIEGQWIFSGFGKIVIENQSLA